MKLVSMTIENFRSYKEKTQIKFDNFTAFVGKNDVGKSTILEALDLFFNDGSGVIKKDNGDINITNFNENKKDIIISACFTDLPPKIIIDTNIETTLEQEYMLNLQGELEIVKKWSSKTSTYIRANHPTNPICEDLLLKKNSDLVKIINKYDIPCENKNVNSIMRRAIWNYCSEDLNLKERELNISKEDCKVIWDKLSNYLPLYSLFQSDRKNNDSDDEIQDPLKEAVKEILKTEGIANTLSEITNIVSGKLQNVVNRTLEKLNEMDGSIATSLDPKIPSPNDLKWSDVFKSVSITGDENIPINKRGSGVKRLILLNFFRAQAEEKAANSNHASVIYAIEEPETSQHSNNQILIINALKKISEQENCQVIITTHSPIVVKQLEFENIWLLKNESGKKIVDLIKSPTIIKGSLNEVNYLAFEELSYEYHDELYAYLEMRNVPIDDNQIDDNQKPKKQIDALCDKLEKRLYNKLTKNGPKPYQIALPEYIRHQIHHPENTLNTRFTLDELKESIDIMRQFIIAKSLT